MHAPNLPDDNFARINESSYATLRNVTARRTRGAVSFGLKSKLFLVSYVICVGYNIDHERQKRNGFHDVNFEPWKRRDSQYTIVQGE